MIRRGSVARALASRVDPHHVLEANGQDLAAVLVGNFYPMRKAEVTFTDLRARKVSCAFLGLGARVFDAAQLEALGIERDIIAVNVEEETYHLATTL